MPNEPDYSWEGHIARIVDAAAYDDCPYSPDTPARFQWEQGWTAAELALCEKQEARNAQRS